MFDHKVSSRDRMYRKRSVKQERKKIEVAKVRFESEGHLYSYLIPENLQFLKDRTLIIVTTGSHRSEKLALFVRKEMIEIPGYELKTIEKLATHKDVINHIF